MSFNLFPGMFASYVQSLRLMSRACVCTCVQYPSLLGVINNSFLLMNSCSTIIVVVVDACSCCCDTTNHLLVSDRSSAGVHKEDGRKCPQTLIYFCTVTQWPLTKETGDVQKFPLAAPQDKY
jgi:hypothetical protein